MRPVIASSESIAPRRLVMIQRRIARPSTTRTATIASMVRDSRASCSGGASATGVVGAAMVSVTPPPPLTIAAED